MRTMLIAAVGAAALTLTGCAAATTGPVAGTHPPTKIAAAKPTVTPTVAAAQGTRSNPFPIGAPGKYDPSSVWTFTWNATNPNAGTTIQQANTFNSAPPSGDVDVLGTLTVAADKTMPASGATPAASFSVNYVGADGNTYAASTDACGVLPGTNLQNVNTMYGGASQSVSVCAQVPQTAVTGGEWNVSAIVGSNAVVFFKAA